LNLERTHLLLRLALCGALLAAADAAAQGAAPGGAASTRYDDTDDRLSGRDIYERVLRNRYQTYIQQSSLLSGDRAGNEQETRLKLWFESYKRDGAIPDDGVLSNTIVKYTHPFDLRHAGYLIINHQQRPSDQFVYLPTYRRTRRVNLRGEAVFGTDFSFEDVIPRELDDATYERRPDAEIQGRKVFVVQAVPTPEANSEYARFEVWVDKDKDVPLRTRYWDNNDIEVKGLEVVESSIERIEGVWVPMRMTMRNLRLDTYTTLQIEKLEPNVTMGKSKFTVRRLEGH
jgi:hypothetical protein